MNATPQAEEIDVYVRLKLLISNDFLDITLLIYNTDKKPRAILQSNFNHWAS